MCRSFIDPSRICAYYFNNNHKSTGGGRRTCEVKFKNDYSSDGYIIMYKCRTGIVRSEELRCIFTIHSSAAVS